MDQKIANQRPADQDTADQNTANNRFKKIIDTFSTENRYSYNMTNYSIQGGFPLTDFFGEQASEETSQVNSSNTQSSTNDSLLQTEDRPTVCSANHQSGLPDSGSKLAWKHTNLDTNFNSKKKNNKQKVQLYHQGVPLNEVFKNKIRNKDNSVLASSNDSQTTSSSTSVTRQYNPYGIISARSHDFSQYSYNSRNGSSLQPTYRPPQSECSRPSQHFPENGITPNQNQDYNPPPLSPTEPESHLLLTQSIDYHPPSGTSRSSQSFSENKNNCEKLKNSLEELASFAKSVGYDNPKHPITEVGQMASNLSKKNLNEGDQLEVGELFHKLANVYPNRNSFTLPDVVKESFVNVAKWWDNPTGSTPAEVTETSTAVTSPSTESSMPSPYNPRKRRSSVASTTYSERSLMSIVPTESPRPGNETISTDKGKSRSEATETEQLTKVKDLITTLKRNYKNESKDAIRYLKQIKEYLEETDPTSDHIADTGEAVEKLSKIYKKTDGYVTAMKAAISQEDLSQLLWNIAKLGLSQVKKQRIELKARK